MIILIGVLATLLIFLVLFWFFSNADLSYSKEDAVAALNNAQKATPKPKAFTISSKDIETIAGDDLMITQLDLARAYIETERRNLAKSILTNVARQGNAEQKIEARRLMESARL